MTDPFASHLDDEDLSAVLDGEATDVEARHAAECDVCAARLATLRAVAGAVGSPVAPLAADRLDEAVAAALSARSVVPISAARSARRAPAWLGAAAAVLAVVAVGGLLGRGGDSSNDMPTAAGGSDDAAEQSATAAEGEVAEESAADSTMSLQADADQGAGSAVGTALGELSGADLHALVDGAAARQAPAAAGGDEAETAADEATMRYASACEEPLRAGDPTLGALVFTGEGTWEGELVSLVVFETGGGSERRAYVVAGDCSVRSTDAWSV